MGQWVNGSMSQWSAAELEAGTCVGRLGVGAHVSPVRRLPEVHAGAHKHDSSDRLATREAG